MSISEGALRILASTTEVSTPRQFGSRMSTLYSFGLISDSQQEFLRQLWSVRSEVSHGGTRQIIDPTLVYRAARFARRVASGDYVPVGHMVDWFFETYEDPGQHVPHDSSEGGYQYLFGGPYEATDALFERFPGAGEEELMEAAEIIEDVGSGWVRKGQY